MVDEKGLVAITFSANGPRRHLSGQETTSTVTRLGLVPYSRARKRRRQEAGRQDEHYGQDRQKSWMGMKMVSAHPTDCHDQNRSGRRAKNGSGGGRKGRSGGGRKNRVPLILSLSKDERRSNAILDLLAHLSGKSKDGRGRRKKRWREKIGGSFSVSRRRRGLILRQAQDERVSDGRLILRQAQDERVSPTGGSSFDRLRMSESPTGGSSFDKAQDERVSPAGGSSFDR